MKCISPPFEKEVPSLGVSIFNVTLKAASGMSFSVASGASGLEGVFIPLPDVQVGSNGCISYPSDTITSKNRSKSDPPSFGCERLLLGIDAGIMTDGIMADGIVLTSAGTLTGGAFLIITGVQRPASKHRGSL
ncbi:hypothetical protein FGRMN_7262 [Fusarium graminum]|nr:hypothetical protein FGRMN_7262 [Fusarium graminum]